MEKRVKPKTAMCEIEAAIDVMGGKWKPLILMYLSDYDTIRFSQFQHLMPEITHRVLSKQLRELEEYKLIERTVYPDVPLKVEYKLVGCGKDLIPILDMMCDWASKNDYFGYEIKYNLCDEEEKS